MTSPSWDPWQYLRHSGPRSRPLQDLLARVPVLPGEPAPRIADLGCGPGGPALPLLRRWPAAHLTGYDNSPAMLEKARAYEGSTPDGGTLDFVAADIADWRPRERFGLIFSNAALHWVPGHTAAFPAWIDALEPGGSLAFQVPGNCSAPSHTLLDTLRNSPPWQARLGTRRGPETESRQAGTGTEAGADAPADPGPVLGPAGYFAELAPLGCDIDTWETTYLHLLPGEDAVLDWVRGTTLRPVLTRLADDPTARDAFLAEYREELRNAYPPTPHGTLFPFRRIFVVATKPGRQEAG